MDGIKPIQAKITVNAVLIREDGSREDLGDLLGHPYDNKEEQEWPEQ